MKKNKIELYEGDTKAVGIRLIGILPENILALSVVIVNDLGNFREEYSLDNERLTRNGEIWEWSINDQSTLKKFGRGKWQINLKTLALGWQHSEVFDFEIKKSVNLQPLAAPATATVISQIFEIEFTTELIISSAMLYNLFRGPSAYEIAVSRGFVGTEEAWNNQVYANVLASANSATSAQTAATAAANSATSAQTAATAAANSATSAQTAATAAANSATSAQTAATAAANSVTSAQTAATEAANSANSAQTAATEAANSATSAQTAATEAANSATSAQTAATGAANSAHIAQTAATEAAIQSIVMSIIMS